MSNNEQYDVIVIGGGPSGLMASYAAGYQGARVLLVDKGNKLGRKLAISGGGRCNVTNRIPLEEMIKNIPGNGRFMYSPFSIYNNEHIISFFEDLGIELKEEDRGRMFPVTDKAKDVVEALIQKVREVGTDIRVNTAVKDISFDENMGHSVHLDSGEAVQAPSVIIAVGGKSVPHTGSTGDGYAWAEKAGHTITELYPTEVPVTSDEPFIKEKRVQGLALRDVHISVKNPKGKSIMTHEGDVLFTHFGLSGPAVLRCSQYVIKAKKKYQVHDVPLDIDMFPEESMDELLDRLWHSVREEGSKQIKNVLNKLIPERLLPILLERAELDGSVTGHQCAKQHLRTFTEKLKAFHIKATGTLSIEQAFVTGGGVNIKEIHPKSMASKKTNGLYFCGEILDIHGYTGGYNITCAFSTGYVAGTSAAQHAQQDIVV
ncbi:NAD(P)/FAD-dependent oxidoreductase [Caldalkalibacillus salinus]|uniref:NAD(P)/FAD-dependent oxidoreductase n=1 Tax=Caldalkalibacillus salinus TaxID=2803787 RepID=UPI0019234B03|nr:NAD(P)/FAD-dependent oxidoreductase [Caldalkalibacillus salinus]